MANKRGSPTKYKPEYAELGRKYCLLGATDENLAEFFDVTVTTINNWKIEHPEFFESIKKGKHEADALVAASLYQTALDGNTTAQIFWLKNRSKAHWRDKQEVEHTGNVVIQATSTDERI